jgi:hypothetical protein
MFLGYNYRIMLKRLVMIACFAALIVTVILVARYDKLHDTEGKGYDIKCTQPSEPSATMNSLICTAEHGQKAETSEYGPAWWHVFFAWPEGITALLILLTLVAISLQTFYTRRAAEATEGAVAAANSAYTLAEKTAKQQLRAYMLLRRARLFILEEGALKLKVEIENYGQTPAYEFSGRVETAFSAYPIPLGLQPARQYPESKGMVGSGGAFYGGGVSPYMQWNIEDLRNKLGKVYFVIAKYTYLDIFKEEHHLRLQLFIGGLAGVHIETDESGRYYEIYTDARGNEAD